MKAENPLTIIGLAIALAALLSTCPLVAAAADEPWTLPIPVPSVDQALAPEQLRAAADKTDDPDVLLGLLYLSRRADPAFTELAARVVKAKADFAAAAAVVRVIVAVDEPAIEQLIAIDPANALGHYLRAHHLYAQDRDAEALAAYRRGAETREMRLYESATSAGLFKALTALKLEGRDRLCALSWVASRAFNFGVTEVQPLAHDLAEIARHGPAEQREAMSDMLLVLAGQLYATNADNRRYGDRALESAFRLKAELAAEQNSPKMDGYAAVTQALVSTMISLPGQNDAREAAWFLPSRVYHAFGVNNRQSGARPTTAAGAEHQAELEAGEALLAAAARDPDVTVGAYLKGLIPPPQRAKPPWVFRHSYVDKLMDDAPELFAVATTYEKAMRAAQAARQNDEPLKNMRQMMQIGLGVIGYAFEHDNTYPPTLQTLVDQKLLEGDAVTTSLLSQRPYVFPAAGEKMPAKGKDRDRLILLYDDQPIGDSYQCILGDGHGEHIPVEKVKEQLKARGK